MKRHLIAAIVLTAGLAAVPAYAQDAPAANAPAANAETCEFLWPLETEMGWMRAAEAEKAASGATLARLPDDKAVELALKPTSEVAFPAKPTRTPKAGDAKTFGGFVNVETAEAAHVQVTLSAHAWIDVVQNGKPLEATAHTGAMGCPVARKSVRFEVGAGPLTIQLSGADTETIRIAVRPAAD
ncbi:hypothetical protein [Hyphomicrobium sp.]|jgi:hypothetical protein|uniref:hypothetical protein n=1 Tax=Hyphomicrobium sp. TaxID=82 RepID=UPI002FE0E483